MKKAQFFLISLVLIVISMFYVYTYIRSSDLSSTLFFERPAILDVQNMIDAIKLKNDRQSQMPPWWNSSWQYRKTVAISANVGTGTTVVTFEFDPSVAAARLLSGSCTKELRMTNRTTSPLVEIESNITAASQPCNLVRQEVITCAADSCTVTFNYYVYYGHANPDTPSYRNTLVSGGAQAATVGLEELETKTKLCNHFKAIYPKMGAQVDCNVINYSGNRTNISLYYNSPTLKFNGTVI